MKNNCKYLIFIVLILILIGCNDDWLERKPKDIITEEQVWSDPKQILALLANFYNRIPVFTGLEDITSNDVFNTTDYNVNIAQWRNMANFDDAMWSGYTGEDGRNQLVSYNYDFGRLWNYGLIRDINLSLDNIEKYSVDLSDAQKKQFSAELRFIRAYNYFELVRRMGGVPLVTKPLIYNFNGDPTPLQQPRAKESEVYDFIASEMDAIKNDLGNDGSYSRANKYTALALKSRAMLYAGSLAKYNNLMPVPITTAGGEVGIPASMATAYYQKSLEASKEIIESGWYSLYKDNPDPGENFFNMLMVKASNPEIIFAKDFLASKDKRHAFAYDNIARDVREDNLGSSAMTPSLNLVECFDYLDGSKGTIKNKTANESDYIYYTNLQDIFANKDARLYGTVIYPGTKFRGVNVQMQAGVKVWNSATGKYDNVEGDGLGKQYDDGGILTGTAGPHRSMQEVTNTGFYFRKFVSAGAGASTRGIRSDNWWPWFRLGEIYLNAAEAAFELGAPEAVDYINTVRERAGFPANSISTLTFEIIQNERRVELAFEDHRWYDLKRWRIAHIVWNGDRNNADAMVYALYPYRVVNPGNANDGKYVYDKMIAPRFREPRFFRMGNYYSSIRQLVIDNNPKIVPNPFH